MPAKPAFFNLRTQYFSIPGIVIHSAKNFMPLRQMSCIRHLRPTSYFLLPPSSSSADQLPRFAPGVPCFFTKAVAFPGLAMNLDSEPLFFAFLPFPFPPFVFFGVSSPICNNLMETNIIIPGGVECWRFKILKARQLIIKPQQLF